MLTNFTLKTLVILWHKFEVSTNICPINWEQCNRIHFLLPTALSWGIAVYWFVSSFQKTGWHQVLSCEHVSIFLEANVDLQLGTVRRCYGTGAVADRGVTAAGGR
jgi:hypothetical protein